MNKADTYLGWLIGQRLTQASNSEHFWLFAFENGGTVTTEDMWRLLSGDRLTVTSEDHGQKFGLPSPVDASKRVLETIATNRVNAYSLSPRSSDLVLDFDNGAQLQLLNMSCGYESWHTASAGVHVICMGGGNLSTYDERALPEPKHIIRPQPLKL